MPHLRYARIQQHGFIEVILGTIFINIRATLMATNSGGESKNFSLSQLGGAAKTLFFNTYFLDDGDYTFDLQLFDGAEGRSEILSGQFSICNGESSLSADLRQSFRLNPQCALIEGPIDSTYFDFLPDRLRSTNYPFHSRVAYHNDRRILRDEQIRYFDKTGTLILEGFFDKAAVETARVALAEVNEKDLFGFKKGSSQRIVNLHESYEQLNALYSSKRLYDLVSDLFGVQAFPCQSLTFINGSTQDAHQDTVHLTPFPRGLMCGIWIAIEDVVPGAGELVFYPGSHTLPAVLCSSHNVPKVDSEDGDYSKFGEVFTPLITDLLSSNPQLERRQFLAKAGDVLIWQENLIHGGAQRVIQDQTRMSMVIHAFGEPTLIYYDSLGMSGKRDASLN